MAFPIISGSLYFAPAAAPLDLGSLNILLQETDSAYPAEIPDSNEHLLESHALLVYHITGLLQ